MKFGIIAEFKSQGPVLMEAEDTSFDATDRQYRDLLKSPNVVRACMVRLVYVQGNSSLCTVIEEDGDGENCL